MNIVECRQLSKVYHRTGGRLLMSGHLGKLLTGHKPDVFYALRSVSFSLPPGESLALVGPNGAGKSTLLSLIAGLCEPDEGTIEVNGKVAALLELGSGFHPDLTGAENVMLNASLLGLKRARTQQLFDRIVDFAEIGDFIKEPLRTYSMGMRLRLAFAVAVNVEPEILIIDEVMAVGDQRFQEKCLEEIHRFRREGRTLICVAHDAALLERFCDRAIWLDHGQMTADGPVKTVMAEYYRSGHLQAKV